MIRIDKSARPLQFYWRVQAERMWRHHWRTLVAVLGGNFLYFVVLYPYLPPAARHRVYQLDWGLVVDFWVCVALYGLIRFPFRRKP